MSDDNDLELEFTQDDVGLALLHLTGIALYLQENHGVPGVTFDSQDGTSCIIISVDPDTTKEIKERAKFLGLDYDDSRLDEVEDGNSSDS